MSSKINANVLNKGTIYTKPFFESLKMIGYLGSFLVVFLILSITLLNGNIVASAIYLASVFLLILIGKGVSLIFRDTNALQFGKQSYFCNFLHPGEYYSYPSLSTMLISFTATYIISSIYFSNNTPSVFMYVLFGLLFVLDWFTKTNGNCTTNTSVLLSLIVSISTGLLLSWVLKVSELKRYYIFSDNESNKAVCSRPKKTQFKCNVYKNGNLVRNVSTDVE